MPGTLRPRPRVLPQIRTKFDARLGSLRMNVEASPACYLLTVDLVPTECDRDITFVMTVDDSAFWMSGSSRELAAGSTRVDGPAHEAVNRSPAMNQNLNLRVSISALIRSAALKSRAAFQQPTVLGSSVASPRFGVAEEASTRWSRSGFRRICLCRARGNPTGKTVTPSRTFQVDPARWVWHRR
jgi:hypothetical protein